jgi:hypothetical protein
MSETREAIQQAWEHANQTRAERLKDLRGTLSLEERLAQLEEMVIREHERLWLVELPEYDEQINRAVRQSYDTDHKAHEHYHQSVQEVRDVKRELEKSIRETLANTIKELIASSDSNMVANALREALKSTVLITRQAHRGELANVGVLVTRQATQAELREQSHND